MKIVFGCFIPVSFIICASLMCAHLIFSSAEEQPAQATFEEFVTDGLMTEPFIYHSVNEFTSDSAVVETLSTVYAIPQKIEYLRYGGVGKAPPGKEGQIFGLKFTLNHPGGRPKFYGPYASCTKRMYLDSSYSCPHLNGMDRINMKENPEETKANIRRDIAEYRECRHVKSSFGGGALLASEWGDTRYHVLFIVEPKDLSFKITHMWKDTTPHLRRGWPLPPPGSEYKD